MTARDLPTLTDACAALFDRHGDTYEGVGWTKSQEHTDRRYDVMLDLLQGGPRPASLLDLGCGTGHLLAHLRSRAVEDVVYTGVDVLPQFVEAAQAKFPDATFHCGELDDLGLGTYDYVVMNGLFTYRGPASVDEMVAWWQRMVSTAMAHADIGVAFNVMSTYVDWEREDLFHPSIALLTEFVAASPCPHFVLRNDYGLYETTVYAFRSPRIG